MFNYAQNIIAIPSDPLIIVSDETEFNYTGISKKIDFGIAGDVTLSFDNLTGHSEISFYLYSPGYLQTSPLMITINGKDYSIPYFRDWKYFLFKIEADVSSIKLTSADPYVYFIDVIGGRIVSEETFDNDIPQAFKDAISLTSPFTTTLSSIDTVNKALTFVDGSGIFAKSDIELSDGVNTEQIRMLNTENYLKLTGVFSPTDSVSVVCPVEITDSIDFANPGIGLEISEDPLTKEISRLETMDGQYKAYEYKEKLVYFLLRCSDRTTFKKLSAEYTKKYGETFFILYDGRRVCVYSERKPVFEKDSDGQYYNAIYVYKITPSMIIYGNYYETTDYLLDVQSK